MHKTQGIQNTENLFVLPEQLIKFSTSYQEQHLLLTECPNDAQFYAMGFSTALLIHAQSSTTLPTCGQNTWSFT
jgi:hypothetical protein